MARLTRLAKRNPFWHRLAAGIVRDVTAKAWMSEIRAVFNFVRGHVRYMLDTNDIEVLQSPEITLENQSGDCDDFCIFLATVLEACGHPCRFVALAFVPGEFTHVIVETRGAGQGGWVSLDATEDFPMGWNPPGVVGQMVQDI